MDLVDATHYSQYSEKPTNQCGAFSTVNAENYGIDFLWLSSTCISGRETYDAPSNVDNLNRFQHSQFVESSKLIPTNERLWKRAFIENVQ